jgi:translation initiation factor IF-3
VNERIRVPQVLVIDDTGTKLGIIPTEQALTLAKEKDLDLVEVAPEARPPVCKFLDYGKYKYSQKKLSQESKHKQHKVQLKEIRLRPKIGEHDFQTKVQRARKFLEKDMKVQVNCLFRGRERAHEGRGRDLMIKFAQELEELAKIEAMPKSEGYRLVMILAKK